MIRLVINEWLCSDTCPEICGLDAGSPHGYYDVWIGDFMSGRFVRRQLIAPKVGAATASYIREAVALTCKWRGEAIDIVEMGRLSSG